MCYLAAVAFAGRPIITKDVILDMKGLGMKTFGTAAQKILHAVSVIDQVRLHPEIGGTLPARRPGPGPQHSQRQAPLPVLQQPWCFSMGSDNAPWYVASATSQRPLR